MTLRTLNINDNIDDNIDRLNASYKQNSDNLYTVNENRLTFPSDEQWTTSYRSAHLPEKETTEFVKKLDKQMHHKK